MKCIKMKAVNNIIQERRLLEAINYPFITNLRFAFQDDENMFMILDLMLGGDLRFHLDRNGPMKEAVVRFYCAELALSINYLHDKQIVHRDLKPDNVLLCEEGHAHLTDFNIAVKYSESTPLKSVAGSMAYMAPEVLEKRGYFATPDWWSLGVILYELLFGRRPFRGKTNDQLTRAITHESLRFPNNAEVTMSKECLQVICGLLERDITKRLGAGKDNFKLLRDHPWFKIKVGDQGPLDWDLVEQKKVKPPFVPDSKRANFDASHELEELLLEENPLRAKKRAGKRDYSKVPGGETGEYAKAYALMEVKFSTFNYERRGEIHGRATSTSSINLKASSETPVVIAKTEEEKLHEISMHDLSNYDKSADDIPKTQADGEVKSETEEVGNVV
eukprot:Partr_v1_DN27766_c1_g1_i3_m67244 putative AGC YANK protein kinase